MLLFLHESLYGEYELGCEGSSAFYIIVRLIHCPGDSVHGAPIEVFTFKTRDPAVSHLFYER